MTKFLNWFIVLAAIAIILPIPLAMFVDMTYHWLLLISIPFGIPLLILLVILRYVLIRKKNRKNEKSENVNL